MREFIQNLGNTDQVAESPFLKLCGSAFFRIKDGVPNLTKHLKMDNSLQGHLILKKIHDQEQ